MKSTHELKTWPQFFEALLSGAKTFEVRRFDRDFKVGDTLILKEWNPESSAYTGREVSAEVTYLMVDAPVFVPCGYCIMGLRTSAEARSHYDRPDA